jgi:Dolichyl-phosphate-mannose-protein mannosyltransferase
MRGTVTLVPTSTAGTRIRRCARVHGAGLAVVATVIGIPLVLSVVLGAFSIPQSDDWAFYRVASGLVDSGEIQLINLGPMVLLGHLAWGAPFLAVLGTSITAAHVAGTVASAIAVLAAYGLFRRFLSPPTAVFATATFGAAPVLAMLSTSYMTDGTMLAAQLVCVLLGIAALDSDGNRRLLLLTASMAVGFLAFSIREPGIAAPLAVLAGHAVAARRSGRSLRPLAASLAVLGIACVALWEWRQGLAGSQAGGIPGAGGYSPSLSATRAANGSLQLYFALALAVVPAIALRWRLLSVVLRHRVALGAAAVVALAGAANLIRGGAGSDLMPGNYVTAHGLQLQPMDAEPLLSSAGWSTLLAATLVAGTGLAGFLALRTLQAASGLTQRRFPALSPSSWTLLVFALVSSALVFGRAATTDPLYDRYLLPIVPPLLVLLLAERSPRPAWVAGTAALLLVGVVAIVYASATSSRAAATWQAAQELVASGHTPTEVDAGYEWIGLHYPGSVGGGTDADERRLAPRPDWMTSFFPRAGNCAIVSARRLTEPWLRPLGTRSYGYMLGTRELWLYRNTRPCGSRGA